MAKKKSSDSSAKSLVIVESPAKARTISKFLGSNYTVEASIGHVRDLPKGADQIPDEYRDQPWSRLGVDVEHDFDPLYIVPPNKTAHIRKLKALVKDAKDLYLATDEDREGEAISWHLNELLQPKVPVHRLVFHEITKEAIESALANPRQIDNDLVRAQEARRIIDRLYGYEVSPLLWKKVRPKLSAGRVQSVAVRLIVDRERQRMAFHSATYWDLVATFATESGESFTATLSTVGGRDLPVGKNFDPATGKLIGDNLLLLDESSAGALAARLGQAKFAVSELENKPYTSKPYPPFTTSTLQQEGNRKLGFTARRTMQVAQSLYENGHITYMRTDSTTLASVAVEAARQLVKTTYGPEYLPAAPRVYQTKVKNAQEAHEAIRPAGHPFDFPEDLRSKLSGDEFKLYDLIWKRTVASQMADARGHRLSVTIASGGGSENSSSADEAVRGGTATFTASGRTIDFPGYLRAYVEGSDDPNADLAERDAVLPPLETKQPLNAQQLEAKSHTTQPPARFTEATLTRSLEEMGIGRPSTYASIIDTILAREYVFKRGTALVPTWTAIAVSQLLESHLPNLVDYQFTAQMEDDLDSISRGEEGHVAYLRKFYFGDGKSGLKPHLAEKEGEINARDVSRIRLKQPEGEEPMYVRVGRYGPFIEQGERRASLPDGLAPDEVTHAAAIELLDRAQLAEEPLGVCPDTSKPVYLKNGRFGPYIQRGTTDDPEDKPQNASLLKGMNPEDIDLATALKLLQLPRELGTNPTNSDVVRAYNGRFGPYVKAGEETRSLPAEISPLDVTLEKALELLAQPKAQRRGFGAKREPIKVFEPASPVTGEKLQLLDGRYGMYVTDGTTNASLPKGATAEELTFEAALVLLAERAAAGPSKKASRKKAKAKVAPAKVATAEKKTAKKKSPAKKSAKKTAKKKKGAGKTADAGDGETADDSADSDAPF